MRKFIVLTIIGSFLLMLAGCASAHRGVTQRDINELLEAVGRAEDLLNAPPGTEKNNGRILFEIPEGIGDATLVVFYSDYGNTHGFDTFPLSQYCKIESLAESIAASFEADLHKLSVAQKYPDPDLDFDDWHSRIVDERLYYSRPELSSGKVENMQSYEHLVIISPLWGFTPIATPVLAFLDDYNLNGKTIIHITYWGFPEYEDPFNLLEFEYPNTAVYFTYFNVGYTERDYAEGFADAYEELLMFLESIL